MVITDIKKRRGRLSEVYIDGEPAVRVDSDTLLLSGHRAGQKITDEQLHALITQSAEKRAKEKALWLLGHRAHTRQELFDKLSRDVTPQAAEQAVARMEALGYLDDGDFARRYAAELFTRKGYAARRVMQALLQKGIEKELAAEAVETLVPDPSEQIEELLRGKLGETLRRENGRDKVVAALRRNGFSWSEIRPCLTEAMKQRSLENGDEPEQNEEKILANADKTEEEQAVDDADCAERIRYLLETKYAHALGNEKERKRTVNSLVRRGFSRRQAEEAVKNNAEQ